MRATAEQAKIILQTRPVARYLSQHPERRLSPEDMRRELSVGAAAICAHQGYTAEEREAAWAWVQMTLAAKQRLAKALAQ